MANMSYSCMSALSANLKFLGLLPNENVKKHTVPDTLYLIGLHTALLFMLVPAIFQCYMNRKTQDVVSLTHLIYTIAVFTTLDLIYLYLCVRKFELRDIISELKTTVDERRKRNPKFAGVYDKAEKYSDFVVRKYFACCFFGSIGVTLMPIAKPLVHHFQGTYSFDSWYTPYPAYLPYNVTHTPIGLAFTLSGQIVAAYLAMPVTVIVAGVFASLMIYVTALFEDTSRCFAKSDGVLWRKHYNDNDFREHLLETVKLHNWAINFRTRVKKFLDAYAFLGIVGADVALCVLLYQFQVSVQNLSIQLYQATGIGVLCFVFLFVFCFFGELLTHHSMETADAAYMSLWYRYPQKYQLHINLIIAYSQIPSTFTAKGIMTCTMETFLGLVKFAVSFYMVLSKTNQ